jgi:UDP-N-acetylglucosamine:LPS N-acetylglucosamine transferase
VLVYSLLKSIFLILKYRPRAIVTTGSFLNAPVLVAYKIVSLFGLCKSFIIIHQQDPMPGLANRFGSKFADLISCVFQYTKDNYPQFKNAQLIPNPMLTTEYSWDAATAISKLQRLNPVLAEFVINKSEKPLLFIFGGGSGALDINNWVDKNFDMLINQFKIIHLIGMFQSEEFGHLKDSDYFASDYLLTEMPLILTLSDLVLARAGLATITELSYLQKPGYLAPLPHSHQETNAKLVKDQFVILDGTDRDSWMDQIERTYPLFFTRVKYPDPTKVETKLQNYFQNLRQKLDNYTK